MVASAGVLGQQPQTLVTGFGPLLYRVHGLQACKEGNCSRSRAYGIAGRTPMARPVETCTILTTTANVTSPVHDRMPVILDPDSYDLWLDPGMRDVSAASEGVVFKCAQIQPHRQSLTFNFFALVKRRRALLETNSPRNNSWRLIGTISRGAAQ